MYAQTSKIKLCGSCTDACGLEYFTIYPLLFLITMIVEALALAKKSTKITITPEINNMLKEVTAKDKDMGAVNTTTETKDNV